MSGLRTTLDHLRSLRRKLESLLDSATNGAPPAEPAVDPGPPALHEVTSFGSNPGALRMLLHVPARLPAKPPLVVALHGCTQSAAGYDRGTGWSALADRQGFVVVYPEQHKANNPKTCFSWFEPGDIRRDSGEALSIRQMVEHAVRRFGVDSRRVFVTGLSAGGAMAAVMLATYPEVFAGGAIIAGLPYGSAATVEEALVAMFQERSPSARALGDRVRAATRHQGPWPRVSVWHGTADAIVKPSNADHSVRQWANVHGVGPAHTREEMVGSHVRRVWADADGRPLIESYTIRGLAHAVPLAASAGERQLGAPGPFFQDVGISSTHRIAHFWGLTKEVVEPLRVAEALKAPVGTAPEPPRYPGPGRFDPGPIIEAALKAAGLSR